MFVVDTYANLDSRYQLAEKLSALPSFLFEKCGNLTPDSLVLLATSSVSLSDNLRLDWGQLESLVPDLAPQQQILTAFIVLGDLQIDGGMLNTNIDGGPALVVKGNLAAHSLVSGGATIIIYGEVTIRDLVTAHYNHGYLDIFGDLYTGVVVRFDHHWFNVDGTVHAKLNLEPETNFGEMFSDVANLPVGMPMMQWESLLCAYQQSQEKMRAELEVQYGEEAEDVFDDCWYELHCYAVYYMLNDCLAQILSDEEDEFNRQFEARLHQGIITLKPEMQNHRQFQPSHWPQTEDEVLAFLEKHQGRHFNSSYLPTPLRQNRDFMLRITRLHPSVFHAVSAPWHLCPDFLHAGLDAGSKKAVDYIRYIDDPLMRQSLEEKAARFVM